MRRERRVAERERNRRDAPGSGKSITLQFNDDFFDKGDILYSSTEDTKLLVTKVYKRTWWRRLLTWLGFKTVLLKGQIVVKEKNE